MNAYKNILNDPTRFRNTESNQDIYILCDFFATKEFCFLNSFLIF